MAITPAACQAALDSTAQGKVANIVRADEGGVAGAEQRWYVVGVTRPYAGRSRWVNTTASDDAATQAAAILAALVA